MSRFPGSESSSGSPPMGRLPLSEASTGSPPLGSFLPSESFSGSPPLGHFRFKAGAGSSGHLSSAIRTHQCTPAGSYQHCSPETSAQDRSLKKLPPKPPRSMRSPRPFSSRMEKASPADTHQDRKMGCSSNEESVEKQPNSTPLKIIIRWNGNKPGGSDNAAEEKDCGGEPPKGEEEAKLEEEEKVEEEKVEEGEKVENEKIEEEEKVEKEKVEEEERVDEEEKVEDLVEKKWNLRPRKPIKKAGAGAGKEPQWQEGSSSQKAPKKKPAAPKKPKPLKLSIALTRREIEEDLYAMTGTRPSRKPKRRPKQLQNIVNVRQSGPLLVMCFDSSLLVIF